ncbi:WXG100 family type VII secretion target [Streptomyces albus]|uniref:WXG100 family type VII secretion target n=1 Tax=Streptomyces albus TaxID=1888 RepID=UPI0014369DD3|nr:WXG100 family type VII secretion target [Streptomyces albus]UVN55725.1 WXG100 family type VII secretion target [Streptomyces albus]
MSDDGSNAAAGSGIAPPPMPGLGPPAGSTDGSAPPVPESWQQQANADQIGDYARTPYPSPPSTEQSTGAGAGAGAPPAGTEGGTGGDGGGAPSDYSLAQFHVDLQALSDATTEVGHVSTEIAGYMRTISALATQLHDHWDGPAYLSFGSVQQWFQHTEKQLHDLLDEIVRRMKISYDNFRQAEAANFANLLGSEQQLAGTPQPSRPREVYVLEHAGADGAPVDGGAGREGPRVLLPAPEGVTGPFKPETVPLDEYLSGAGGDGSAGVDAGGAVPSLPREEWVVEHVNPDGTPVDGGAGQGEGGAVPSLPREEWVVEHVNPDGTPVDGGAGQGEGGGVPSLPREEWVVEHVNADGTPVGGVGSGGGDQGAAASVAEGAHEEGPRVLLPAPEGVTGPFKPETVPLDEYLSGAGAAGAGGDGSAGADAGGGVPSLPREEWVIEHVNADGTPVTEPSPGDGGGQG